MSFKQFGDEDAQRSEDYLDAIFGPGKGAAHRQFLSDYEGTDRFLPAMDFYHVLSGELANIPVAEHYLIGACILFVRGANHAAMGVVKIALANGVDPDKVRAAISRLALWNGSGTAAEGLRYTEKAIRQFQERGLDSLPWFKTTD